MDFIRNWITRPIITGGKFWKNQYFFTCSVRGGFTFYSNFFTLLAMKVMMRPHAVPKECININTYWIT
jgi:hypothetical protein